MSIDREPGLPRGKLGVAKPNSLTTRSPDMDKLFSGLKLDYWYHVFVVVGAAGAILAMTIELKGVANSHALLGALGMFFVGLGEWINHPFQTILMLPNADLPRGGKLTGYRWKPSLLGILFDLAGLALAAVAIYKIAKAA